MSNYWEIFWLVYYLSIPVVLAWNIVAIYQLGELLVNDLFGIALSTFMPVLNTGCICAVVLDWIIRQNFVIWRQK